MPERPPSTPTCHLYTCVHPHRYVRPYGRTHIPTNSGTRVRLFLICKGGSRACPTHTKIIQSSKTSWPPKFEIAHTYIRTCGATPIVLEVIMAYTCAERIKQTVSIDATTVDIEEKGVKLRLTVVDTPGFGDAVDNRQWYVQRGDNPWHQ